MSLWCYKVIGNTGICSCDCPAPNDAIHTPRFKMPPMNPQATSRTTIATSPAQAAPIRIILLSLPLWGASMLLMLFMPFTGLMSFTVIALCLLWLPFTAKRGTCPHCDTWKTFPFSGFGSPCKVCHYELVLRGSEIHQLEHNTNPRYGAGRTHTS